MLFCYFVSYCIVLCLIMSFYVLLCCFVLLRCCFMSYYTGYNDKILFYGLNIVLCLIMLFCNVIMLIYFAMLVRNDAKLFCNVIMFFLINNNTVFVLLCSFVMLFYFFILLKYYDASCYITV